MPHAPTLYSVRSLSDGMAYVHFTGFGRDEAQVEYDRILANHRAAFDPDGPEIAVQLLDDRGEIVADETITSLDPIPTGTRVALAPHTDDWMRGRRYGTIADDSIVPDAPRRYLLQFDDGEYGWFAEGDLLRPVP